MINFDNTVELKKSVQILKNLIKSDKIGHAYLFTGREGSGKKSAAIAFAKAINCSNLSENYNPCNHCSSCLKIEKEIHPDFQIIFPLNSIISIDQIREIKKVIYWPPLESRKKIFIIDDAHKMTIPASNSLLKILEEPPAFAVLILITSKPEILLPTVISRCYQISFKQAKKANELAAEQPVNIEQNRYIDWLLKAKSAKMIHYFFSAQEKELNVITDSLLDFTEVMILWFRDILVFKLGLPQELLSFSGQIDNIVEFAQNYSPDKIMQVLDYLTQIPERMEQHIKPKKLLEKFIMQIGY